MYYSLSDQSDNFDDDFEKNRLYLYTGDVGYYGYADNDLSVDSDITDTYFARYISFLNVVE
jgi:hypothetical protein